MVVQGVYREYGESRIHLANYDYDTKMIGPYKIVDEEYIPNLNQEYPVIPCWKLIQALYIHQGLAAIPMNNYKLIVLNRYEYIHIAMRDIALDRHENHFMDLSSRYDVNYNGYEKVRPITMLCSMDIPRVVGDGELPPLSEYSKLVKEHPDCTLVINDGNKIIFK